MKDIDNAIKNNNVEDEDEGIYPRNYSEETLREFRNGIEAIKKAQVYMQRIDWLLSGDDGEETFHERLAEDLSEDIHL